MNATAQLLGYQNGSAQRGPHLVDFNTLYAWAKKMGSTCMLSNEPRRVIYRGIETSEAGKEEVYDVYLPGESFLLHIREVRIKPRSSMIIDCKYANILNISQSVQDAGKNAGTKKDVAEKDITDIL